MRYFSLFSGIGGFELGIGDKGRCVGYSEIDKNAIRIYERHFKHKNYGDITHIVPSELPDFELLVGGFPCPTFSIAGKRAGFSDRRGELIFDVVRILKAKRPKYIILEDERLKRDESARIVACTKCSFGIGYQRFDEVVTSLYKPKPIRVPNEEENLSELNNLGRGELAEDFSDSPYLDTEVIHSPPLCFSRIFHLYCIRKYITWVSSLKVGR